MKLFQEIHQLDKNGQNTYLLGLIDILPVQRRRHGKYDSPSESRRQTSVSYIVPNGEGHHIRVCKNTFMAIFGIKSSKRVGNLVANKKMGKSVMKDRRGGLKTFKYTLADRNAVKAHIKSIPSEPSHYNRNRSDSEYLSQDLNLHRLYKAFMEKFPNSKISYHFYAMVFKTDFPKLKFRKPRVDTCKKCDRLKIEMTSKDPAVVRQATTEQEQHHRKSESAYKSMTTDSISSATPSSNTCTVVIDLQKVFPLPKLTHSDMYYARQLSCYNFGIHVTDTSSGIMCLWHEGQSSRGGNQMASCLFRVINNMNLTNKRNLTIWSDNCCGQIKNRMMVFMYMYLVSLDLFDKIDHKFLVVGHSFSAADRNFAVIEKHWKRVQAETPEDVKRAIIASRHERPFKVVEMGEQFLDFDQAASSVINTKKLGISTASWIRIEKKKPGVVQTRKTFNDIEQWVDHYVFNPGVNEKTLQAVNLKSLPSSVDLGNAKKADLRKMLPYIKEENRAFFERICIN